MNNKRNDSENDKIERTEDVTLYGENIPSQYQWMTPKKQKRVAKHLEEISEELSDDFYEDVEQKKKNNRK